MHRANATLVSLLLLFSVGIAGAQWGHSKIIGDPAPEFTPKHLTDAEERRSSYLEKWC